MPHPLSAVFSRLGESLKMDELLNPSVSAEHLLPELLHTQVCSAVILKAFQNSPFQDASNSREEKKSLKGNKVLSWQVLCFCDCIWC